MLGFRSSFFKLHQPRRFEFHTRYYDAAKEDLHARIKFTEARLEAERKAENGIPTDHTSRMMQAFRQARRQSSSPVGGSKGGLFLNPVFMRLMFILIFVVDLYVFFYGEEVVEWLNQRVFESVSGVLVAVLVLATLMRLLKWRSE